LEVGNEVVFYSHFLGTQALLEAYTSKYVCCGENYGSGTTKVLGKMYINHFHTIQIERNMIYTHSV